MSAEISEIEVVGHIPLKTSDIINVNPTIIPEPQTVDFNNFQIQ